jgi:4-phospho-D-threonate 3-dehydrogenase / 4-phospho-D-erythronate 3-dehydrogenase
MRLGITVGDPAGIGPEITLKALAALADRRPSPAIAPIVYGSASGLVEAARRLGLAIEIVGPGGTAAWPAVAVADIGAAAEPIELGTVTAAAGGLAYAAIERAVRDALSGEVAGIVTGPISKEAINLAGHAYSGHTDMLAALTGTSDTCMMLAHDNLRISHVSTHVPLSRVSALVTPARLSKVLELTFEALAAFAIDRPRIGVAALNPHAGEGGLFGREDADVIAPTVEQFCRRGFSVAGPISGDTVFVRAMAGEFDAVIAMFHDQGHIPIKLLGFKVDPATRAWTSLNGVNITLGLPFVRTSVDHGTAFDIASKGIASAQSMIEAIDIAVELVPRSRSVAVESAGFR